MYNHLALLQLKLICSPTFMHSNGEYLFAYTFKEFLLLTYTHIRTPLSNPLTLKIWQSQSLSCLPMFANSLHSFYQTTHYARHTVIFPFCALIDILLTISMDYLVFSVPTNYRLCSVPANYPMFFFLF